MQQHLIIDIGAHRGEDAEYYLSKGFRVVAVEANPILVDHIKSRLGSFIQAGQLTLLHYGIADRKTKIPFYINDKDDWSSFVPEFGQRNGKFTTVTVDCISLTDILHVYGEPYYLKIDIEGHDDLCIRDLLGGGFRPKYVSVEATVPNFFQRMLAGGYSDFKIVSQIWHTLQKPMIPPLEGKVTHMPTTGFMTGPFGEESPGPWISAPDASLELTLIHQQKWGQTKQHLEQGVPLGILEKSWFDFHARLSEKRMP